MGVFQPYHIISSWFLIIFLLKRLCLKKYDIIFFHKPWFFRKHEFVYFGHVFFEERRTQLQRQMDMVGWWQFKLDMIGHNINMYIYTIYILYIACISYISYILIYLYILHLIYLIYLIYLKYLLYYNTYINYTHNPLELGSAFSDRFYWNMIENSWFLNQW